MLAHQSSSRKLLLRVLREPENRLHSLQRRWYVAQRVGLAIHCKAKNEALLISLSCNLKFE